MKRILLSALVVSFLPGCSDVAPIGRAADQGPRLTPAAGAASPAEPSQYEIQKEAEIESAEKALNDSSISLERGANNQYPKNDAEALRAIEKLEQFISIGNPVVGLNGSYLPNEKIKQKVATARSLIQLIRNEQAARALAARELLSREAIARLTALEQELDKVGVAFKVNFNSVQFSSMPGLAENKTGRFDTLVLLSTYYKALGKELRSGVIIDSKQSSEFELKQQLTFKVGAAEMKKFANGVIKNMGDQFPGVVLVDEQWVLDVDAFATFDGEQMDDLVNYIQMAVAALEETSVFFDVKDLKTRESLDQEDQESNRYGFDRLVPDAKIFAHEHRDLMDGSFAKKMQDRAKRIEALVHSLPPSATKKDLEAANAKRARQALEEQIAISEKRLAYLGWKIGVQDGKPAIDAEARKRYQRDHRFEPSSILGIDLEISRLVHLYSELYFVLPLAQANDTDAVRALLEAKHLVLLDMVKAVINDGSDKSKLDSGLLKMSDEALKEPLKNRRQKVSRLSLP